MKRSALAVAASMLAAGCGYIGGPLAPLANVPARVLDLAAVQRGNAIVAQFTIPIKTTENVAIKETLKLDLRVGTGVNPFNADRWAEQAKQIPEPSGAKGIARYEIPAAEWTGKEVTIGVRTIGANGKPSEWSNFVQVQVVPPPTKPTDLHGESTPAGIRLTWKANGDHFRVLRKVATEQSYAIVAPDLHTPEFVDTTAAVGAEYLYLVQTFVRSARARKRKANFRTSSRPRARLRRLQLPPACSPYPRPTPSNSTGKAIPILRPPAIASTALRPAENSPGSEKWAQCRPIPTAPWSTARLTATPSQASIKMVAKAPVRRPSK